ncbi:MAG TPA: RHS repeat-associated core domain-containing protein [Bacteroidota bacterium]|nr:RHS repeat-associated core domain-containing protein [Bacteroidota bacterium]
MEQWILQGKQVKKSYAYDIAGRLWKVWRNDTLISEYTYDANGNRISHWTPSEVDSGSYDAQDRMLSYGNAQYFYTPNGELRMKVEGSDTTFYTYDYFGNLITVILPNKDRIDYIIDGQNRRIGKKLNGQIVKKWIYSGQLTPVAELDSAGNITARFAGSYMIKDGATYQLITDHLGSVRLVINIATGTVMQRLDYDEYGNVTYDTNPDFQPFGFCGGLYDAQTKLVRFGYRDYDAETGRWTSKDPIGFGGGVSNVYVYCLNDPINFVDPSGLRLCRINLPGMGNTYLDEAFGALIRNWINANAAAGINVSFTSGFRTTARQRDLQNDPNAIAPAPAGSSLHEAGFAVDIKWGQLTAQQQNTVVQNAYHAGISWGGNWHTRPENWHFYFDPGDRTARIRQAQQEYQQGVNCNCP